MIKKILIAGALLFPAAAFADGVIVVDHDAALSNCAAIANAISQIKTTYAATIAAVEAKAKAQDAMMQPKVAAFQAAQKVPNANRAVLQNQYNELVQMQQANTQELQKMALPYERAKAYAIAGVEAHFGSALKTVMEKRAATIVIAQQATLSYKPAVDATTDITAALNAEVPSVSITAPADWNGQALPSAGAAAAPSADGGR